MKCWFEMLFMVIIILLLFFTPSQSTDSSSKEHHVNDNDDNEDTRPNILLLLTDDQDVMVGGMDKMKNLQRLLQERGTTFTNAFVHTPICCPSRSSILTGRYLHNGGALDNSIAKNCNGYDWQQNAEQATFAVQAQKAGYVTSYAGKYLNGYGIKGSPHCHDDRNGEDSSGCTRVPPGWDKWLGLIGNSQYYGYGVVHSENGGNASAAQVKHYGQDYKADYFPDLVANFTLKQIKKFITANRQQKQRRRRKPFLAVTAWPTAHMPFTPAPWAEDMYNGIKAHKTPNYNASAKSLQDKHWMMQWLAPIDENVTAKWIDQVYENRTKALQSVDRHIAQFVKLLEQYDEYDNTIIIYTSDNGWQLGQHRLAYDKRQLYEHDIRVPFIVTWGGRSTSIRVPQNVSNPSIVLNIDIAPTIHHVVTGTNPFLLDSMDGQSFLPTLPFHTTRTTTTDAVFAESANDNNNNNNTKKDRRSLDSRHDFLISYHGRGLAQCGNFWECPVPKPSEYHMGDWTNNTYHCVRTIIHDNDNTGSDPTTRARRDEKSWPPPPPPLQLEEDSIYCRFEDDENFVEYYDLIEDKWQLHNAYHSLTMEQRVWYENRLRALKSCKGQSCRSKLPINGVRSNVQLKAYLRF